MYKTFRTGQRRAFVRITEEVQRAVDEAGLAEGMVPLSAMPASRTSSCTTR